MTGSLKVAIAGAGMVVQHHLPGWLRQTEVEVVAICDRVQEKAASLAANVPDARVYTSLAEMLDSEKPDVLDVTLPPSAHAEAVAQAASRGISILCQKPLAPSLAEAEAMVRDLPPGLRLMVHENWRFRPSYRAIKEWLHSGAFGAPQMFDMKVLSSGLIRRADGVYPALERQPFFRDLERFIVLEVLIHHFDTLAFLFGAVKVLGASLARSCEAIRGEDTAVILLEAGGVAGTLSASFAVRGYGPLPKDELSIICRDGCIVLDGWRVEASRDGVDTLEWAPAEGYQQSYDDTIGHFVTSLRDQQPLETGPEAGLASLAAVEEVYARATRR